MCDFLFEDASERTTTKKERKKYTRDTERKRKKNKREAIAFVFLRFFFPSLFLKKKEGIQ